MPKTKVTITKLEYERRRKGWSKSELARRADLNPSTISGLENGRLTPYEVQAAKLGRALGLPKGEWDSLMESVVE
jgi:ribosome-binding protein aMBF1 (putative translation factor)